MLRFVCVGCVLFCATGCQPESRPGPVLSMHQALQIVDANQRLRVTGLKARGSAAGHFDDGGRRRHFDLDAKLQVLPPDHMRFVLAHVLAGDEVEVGMNQAKWWALIRRPQEQYYEGGHASAEVSTGGTIPLRATRLMESLGLSALGLERAAPRAKDDVQQILYLTSPGAPGDPMWIEKEVWLDRHSPRLIRRILFRDVLGRVVLQSELDDYRAVGDGGLRLPHRVQLTWPMRDAVLTLTIDRWREEPSLTPEHRAFVSPRDRGGRFDFESVESVD